MVDMVPGSIPSPDHIKFMWRWTPHEEVPSKNSTTGGEFGGMQVANFFDPSMMVMRSASSKKLGQLIQEADKSLGPPSPSSGSDPISESKEEGWYWAHVGLRPDLNGPLVLLASISLRSASRELMGTM